MSERLPGLLAAARAHGLRLDPGSASIDESGADFLVAHAADETGTPWIVRVPRRPDVVERAARERRALELLRARLPVAIPEWRIATGELIAYPRLEGEPAAVVDLSAGGYVWRFDAAEPPGEFVESLGGILAALHAIDPAEAVGAGLRVRQPAEIRRELGEEAERARETLTVPDALLQRWRRWLADESFWPEGPALVHGDLHPPHILVDASARVVGLLDWTEAHVADPAMDFTLQLGTMGERALERLLVAYGGAGGRVWPRMREHVVESWLTYPLTVAGFARVTGDDSHRQLAQYLVDAAATWPG